MAALSTTRRSRLQSNCWHSHCCAFALGSSMLVRPCLRCQCFAIVLPLSFGWFVRFSCWMGGGHFVSCTGYCCSHKSRDVCRVTQTGALVVLVVSSAVCVLSNFDLPPQANTGCISESWTTVKRRWLLPGSTHAPPSRAAACGAAAKVEQEHHFRDS